MYRLALTTLVVAAATVLLSAAPVQAQATRTWVSGVGDDANPCSRTAPCKTFAGAISKTATDGEINVLDPGGFGAVTITKSITISSENFEAGVLVSGTNGIVVNGAGVNVTLRGLDIEGLGTGLNGISFLQGAALHVQNCTIRHFVSSWGISFTPNTSAKLFVSDTIIANDGTAGGGGGITVQPTGSGSVLATITRTQMIGGGAQGLRVDTSGMTGTDGASVDIQDSVVSGNSFHGINVITQPSGSPPPATAMLHGVTVSYNVNTGVKADGVAAKVIVGSSTITGNAIGTNFLNGGQLFSYGNNQINGNSAANANISTALSLQ